MPGNNKVIDKVDSIYISFFGDSEVGKTRLIAALNDPVSEEQYEETTCKIYTKKNLSVIGRFYQVGFIDNPGSKEYENYIIGSYPMGNCIVLCFSLVDRKSYESISSYWIFNARLYITPKTPIFLVGTKVDQRDKNNSHHISTTLGMQLKTKIGAVEYLECSAKTLVGIEQLHTKIVHLAAQNHKSLEVDIDDCCFCSIQ